MTPFCIPDFLSDDECRVIEAAVRRSRRGQPRIRRATAGIHGLLHRAMSRVEALSPFTSCGIVTLAEDHVPLGGHYDHIVGDETHKLVIYLDDTAGTLFYSAPDGEVVFRAPARRGHAAVFPIGLWHASELFQGEKIKRTMGLRLRRQLHI